MADSIDTPEVEPEQTPDGIGKVIMFVKDTDGTPANMSLDVRCEVTVDGELYTHRSYNDVQDNAVFSAAEKTGLKNLMDKIRAKLVTMLPEPE